MQYFPDLVVEDQDKISFSDRRFTWGILLTMRKEWAESYYDAAISFQNRPKKKPPERQLITISKAWVKRLTEHDFNTKTSKSPD